MTGPCVKVFIRPETGRESLAGRVKRPIGAALPGVQSALDFRGLKRDYAL